MESSNKSLHPGISWEKDVERVYEPKEIEDTKKTRFFKHRTDAHMDSQKLRQNTQGLKRYAAKRALELKGEVDTWPHP